METFTVDEDEKEFGLYRERECFHDGFLFIITHTYHVYKR